MPDEFDALQPFRGRIRGQRDRVNADLQRWAQKYEGGLQDRLLQITQDGSVPTNTQLEAARRLFGIAVAQKVSGYSERKG